MAPRPRTAFAVVVVLLAFGQPAAVRAERPPIRTLTTADGLPLDQLACVHVDDRGFVWFCTEEGIVRFDGHTAVTFGRDHGLALPRVRSFLSSRAGTLWAGTDVGLFEFVPAPPDGGRHFRPVAVEHARATGAINALTEAADGTLWVGAGLGLFQLTGAGLLRQVDIGLPRGSDNDVIVRAIAEDKHGTLWVGAGSGLYRRDLGGHTSRLTVDDGLPVNEVRSLAIDSNGRAWVGTRNGLASVEARRPGPRRDPPAIRVFTRDHGLPSSNIRAVHFESGQLWVGTVVGVAEIDTSRPGPLEVRTTVTGFWAWDVDLDSRGDAWIATEAGARQLAASGFATYLPEDGLTAARVSSVFETQAGELCATTLVIRVELSCFDGRRFRRQSVPAAERVADPGWGWSQLTLQDRRGRWWVPTGEGLLQFAAGPISTLANASPQRRYTAADGLPSANVFRLFEDGLGHVWVATYHEAFNGLARIDAATGHVVAFGSDESLPERLPIVHAFAEDRAGHIWVGLEEGLLLRYRQGRFERIPLDASAPDTPRPTAEHLRSLLLDRSGRLWIASAVSGLGRIDDPTGPAPRVRWFGTQQGLASNTAWMLAEDTTGHILVGTGRGVDRVSPDGERIRHFGSDSGFPRGEVWGAIRDRNGRIWFATTDGAARMLIKERASAADQSTFVTAVRVAGNALPVSARGTRQIEAVTLTSSDRRLEVDYVSPGAQPADGVRFEYRLGADEAWTRTSARTVSFAGIAPGRHRFEVRAVPADAQAGPAATVDFLVDAPLWQQSWFLLLVGVACSTGAWGIHRFRVVRLLELQRLRARIAADLHDSVGASLSRIAILSEVVRRRAEVALPDALPAVSAIGSSARELIDDMTDAVWFIDPRVDSLQDLVVRVRALAAELFDERGIAWTLDAPESAGNITLSAEQRRHLYLMLKESLTNVVRHASASYAAIAISTARGRLRIDVSDDGVGLASASTDGRGGRGLPNLRHRAATLGGSLNVGPGRAERGTRIVIDLPCRHA